MDIYIIYIIKTLLLPISSLLFLGFAGLFLLSRQQVVASRLICFSLVTLLLLSLPVIAKYLAMTQEIYSPLNNSDVKGFDAQAIVVLGGGLRRPAPEYGQLATLKNSSLARVRYASRLASQTHLPGLVAGGKVLKTDGPSEAEIMAVVMQNEYKQEVLWQDRNSRNTAENALYAQKILAKEGIRRIILVTHALHMRRAVEQFQLQGLQVLPAPTVFLSRTDDLDVFSFLPSARALESSSLVIHEVMGRVWYKLRY